MVIMSMQIKNYCLVVEADAETEGEEGIVLRGNGERFDVFPDLMHEAMKLAEERGLSVIREAFEVPVLWGKKPIPVVRVIEWLASQWGVSGDVTNIPPDKVEALTAAIRGVREAACDGRTSLLDTGMFFQREGKEWVQKYTIGDHVHVIPEEGVRCIRCGAFKHIGFHMGVSKTLEIAVEFSKLHMYCKEI